MNANDWAYTLLLIGFLSTLTYALTTYFAERDADAAHRQRMIDDAYWATLTRAVTRARHDFTA
jgi:hypothetical protein